MNEMAIKEYLNLPENTKRNIFIEISKQINLPAAAIEKDWWVVRTLELVFKTEIAAHTVFKGGTSLSKAWGLIDRFSEDIDLALDRKFLGFPEVMSASQVKNLRSKSFQYLSENFYPDLQKKFKDSGFDDVKLLIRETASNDQDPLTIEVSYRSLTEKSDYLPTRILVEIGSRSLKEPFTNRDIFSFVGEHYSGKPFADNKIAVPTVNPERTFLEKLFLLHEEFQKPVEKIKVNRLSRHLYDLEKLMNTEFAKKAIADKELYQCIIEHRRTLTPVRGIDYANHAPAKINPLPPDNLLEAWKRDYEQMQKSMIYGGSLLFEELFQQIQLLKNRINKIELP